MGKFKDWLFEPANGYKPRRRERKREQERKRDVADAKMVFLEHATIEETVQMAKSKIAFNLSCLKQSDVEEQEFLTKIHETVDVVLKVVRENEDIRD